MSHINVQVIRFGKKKTKMSRLFKLYKCRTYLLSMVERRSESLPPVAKQLHDPLHPFFRHLPADRIWNHGDRAKRSELTIQNRP